MPARRLRYVAETGEACPVRALRIRDIDADHIAPGLYQGGVRRYAGCRLNLKDIDTAILLAPESDVDLRAKGKRSLVLHLDDHRDDLRQIDVLHRVAAELAQELKDGARVATLCYEGRNRSGILSGLVLCELGMCGKDAVRHIKRRRKNALTNEHFVRYLNRLE